MVLMSCSYSETNGETKWSLLNVFPESLGSVVARKHYLHIIRKQKLGLDMEGHHSSRVAEPAPASNINLITKENDMLSTIALISAGILVGFICTEAIKNHINKNGETK